MAAQSEQRTDPPPATARLNTWHTNVVAARQAVADAERALTAVPDPQAQAMAFRNFQSKQHALKQAYRSPA